MGIFGFKSSKEVEEEKRKAAEAAERNALQKNQSNVENLGKGSQFDFVIQYFDVFDPRLQETGVPVSVFGSIVYAIEDMEAFRSMNKVEAYSDGVFNDKLKGGVTKFVKGIISNIPCDYQIPLVQMERKIIQISEIVQSYVIPQVERNFAVKVRSLDITKINVDKGSRGYLELKALTADFEQEQMRMQQSAMRLQQNHQLNTMKLTNDMQTEQMMAQHNAQMKSFNLNNQMQNEMMMAQHSLNMAQQNAQLSNFNLNNSLQQDQLRRQHEMNLGTQEQMAKMQLDAQRMQMDHQQAVNKVQLQEMQRASQLQTEQTFLDAHKANMQNSLLNNAMDMGCDLSQFGGFQQNAMGMQQNMMGMQQNGFGQMPAMGAAPQMPAMKAAVPQVQYNVYINEQQTAGPFDWNQLQSLVQTGQITVQSYVWTQGMAGWELAGNVQELAPLFANTMPGMPQMR
jgi:hypothetical protein